jgi:LacI family transcriptional regulator
MAAAAMSVAHRKGLDVPGDLSVAGFDDTPLATTVWPELTTVCQPIAEMAREAVRLLIEQVRARRAGKIQPVRHVTLEFKLMKRQSTAALVTTHNHKA